MSPDDTQTVIKLFNDQVAKLDAAYGESGCHFGWERLMHQVIHAICRPALAAIAFMLAMPAAGCQSHASSPPAASAPTTILPTKPDNAVIGLPPGTDTTTLQADVAGHVSFYTNNSNKIKCTIEEDQKYEIACYGPFTNTPLVDGKHATGVEFTREGAGLYVAGMGDLYPVLTLDNRTYYFLGWVITARDDGSVALRFHDTGQGIDISIDKIITD